MIQAGTKDGDRPPFGGQFSLVSGSIDPAGEAAHDGDPGIRDLIRQPFCAFQPVMGGPPRPDYTQCVVIPFFEIPPDIQYQRRIVNLAEQWRVNRIVLRDDGCAKLPDPLELGWQVQFVLPIQQRVDRVPRQPLDAVKFRRLSLQDKLGFAKDLEKLSDPYRSYVRHHIQRNQSFVSGHAMDSRSDSTADSRSVRVIFSETKAEPNSEVSTNRICPRWNFLSANTLSMTEALGISSGRTTGKER